MKTVWILKKLLCRMFRGSCDACTGKGKNRKGAVALLLHRVWEKKKPTIQGEQGVKHLHKQQERQRPKRFGVVGAQQRTGRLACIGRSGICTN